MVLFIREREMFSWAKLTRDTAIASLAFAYSVWAIWGSGEAWLAKGFMLLLFGIPVFVWMKWRQRPTPVATPATNGFPQGRVRIAKSKLPALSGAERS